MPGFFAHDSATKKFSALVILPFYIIFIIIFQVFTTEWTERYLIICLIHCVFNFKFSLTRYANNYFHAVISVGFTVATRSTTSHTPAVHASSCEPTVISVLSYSASFVQSIFVGISLSRSSYSFFSQS